MNGERYIKFMRCPIEFHRGERWKKLFLIDPGEPFTLVDITFAWSDDFFTKGVCFPIFGDGVIYMDGEVVEFNAKNDTFPDMTLEYWRELMNYWYEDNNIFGIVLLFQQKRGTEDVWFTTFRSYSARTAKHYRNSVGMEFMLKEVV